MITSIKPFRASHVRLKSSVSLSRVSITIFALMSQNMLNASSLRLRWSPKFGGGFELEAARKIPEHFLKALATKHVCLWYGRTQRRPQARPQFATHIACTAELHTQTSLFVENSIDTLIDVLNTQVFEEDQIEDARQHAHTCNFGHHSRATF